MQTEPGAEARSIVGSELAAMFSVLSLPQLLSHYEDCSDTEWERRCRAFAKQIGLPKHRYVEVCYPFFLSMDWDTRHARGRSLLCEPRVEPSELDQMKAQWVRDEFMLKHNPHPKRQRTGLIHDELFTFRGDVERREQPLAEALAKWSADHGGVDFYQHCIWRSARTDKRLRTVLPEQFHPLREKTPDMNSPAEHAVATVKHAVRELILSFDLHSQELKKGRQYQEFIREAVKSRLTGERGQHHIRGSVRKLPCILKILAAERGEPVQLEHVFGTKVGQPVPEPGPKDRYTVAGTAGAWIRETRWT